MNILMTRPLIDSEDLMAKLFSLGHKIIHIPTLKISPLKKDSVDLGKYDALIFTSTNAIRNLQVVNEEKNKLCFWYRYSIRFLFHCSLSFFYSFLTHNARFCNTLNLLL